MYFMLILPAMCQVETNMPQLNRDVIRFFKSINKELSDKEKEIIRQPTGYQNEDVMLKFDGLYQSKAAKFIDLELGRLGIDTYSNRQFFVFNLYKCWLETGKLEIKRHLKDRFAPPPAPKP